MVKECANRRHSNIIPQTTLRVIMPEIRIKLVIQPAILPTSAMRNRLENRSTQKLLHESIRNKHMNKKLWTSRRVVESRACSILSFKKMFPVRLWDKDWSGVVRCSCATRQLQRATEPLYLSGMSSWRLMSSLPTMLIERLDCRSKHSKEDLMKPAA